MNQNILLNKIIAKVGDEQNYDELLIMMNLMQILVVPNALTIDAILLSDSSVEASSVAYLIPTHPDR